MIRDYLFIGLALLYTHMFVCVHVVHMYSKSINIYKFIFIFTNTRVQRCVSVPHTCSVLLVNVLFFVHLFHLSFNPSPHFPLVQ